MKTVILCGGLGTRLREETEFRPKPMVKIGEKPILWHIMKIYAHQGFKDFILCLGYKGDMIKEYFYHYNVLNNDFTIELGKQKKIEIHSNSDENDWRVSLIDTGNNALKGARIKKIEKYIDGDIFMITYGDAVANINLNELLSFHNSHGRIGTITSVRPPSRFGELISKNNQVVSFTEKPQVSNGLINGGFFVFNRKIFKYLSPDDNCDFEIGALEKLASENELMVYEHTGNWACMDTYRETQYLNELWKNQQAFWNIWDEHRWKV